MDRAHTGQTENLVCYVANLAEDLESWLVHGKIAPEVLAQVCREFRAIADALEADASIPQMPEIHDPPAPRSARTETCEPPEHTSDDDEIPF